ncbi:hypothetical protein ABMA28_015764 [Loxostege sticticalis]|uniref:Cytochrome P450 n=1 Tax=Loxostege sticticalis TaxID=481309 RepID=A0ABD0TB05_LOXSC
MILWLLVITALLYLAMFRFRRRRLYKLASLLPSPDSELPVLGIAYKFAGNTEHIMNAVKAINYETMKNNGILRAWIGPNLFIVLVNPADVEYLMKNYLEKGDYHRFTRAILGNGGIFAPVSIWRRRRKVMVPLFSPKIVETFVEVFSKQSEHLVKLLSSYANTGEISMWPFLSSYTLDSVCETTMGVKINAQGNPNTPFLLAMNTLLPLVSERYFQIWLQPDWLYKFFPKYKHHELNKKKLHDFTDEVIKKKREEQKTDMKNKTESDNEYDLGNYQTKTFLDHLINLSGGEEGYTNLELREETLTLAVAGTDTSAVATGFTMTLLAKYPHIQEKVYQELHEIFGDSERPLVKEDLLKMKYLDRVVKETMRLYPPVPMIIRKVEQDLKLPSGHLLPAGAIVAIQIWGVHHDAKYWGPTVEEFDPDRFLPERFNLAHPCSFMPFSHGPRNCVGYQYAIMSVKSVLSAVIRRYKLVGEPEKTAIPHIRCKVDVMLKAVDGYKLSLERRKPEKSV